MTKIATQLSEIAEPFPALIVDQWGVMHDGYRAFPEAARALSEAKRHGKIVVTLSNSSKPRRLAKEMLDGLGFLQGVHYDHIVTSGADMRDHLLAPKDDFYRSLPESPRLYVLATYDGDLALLDGLPCETTRDLDAADGMIVTGLMEGESPEDFHDLLDRARVRDLPLICPNADRWVAMPCGRLHPCAALVAEAYAERGGADTASRQARCAYLLFVLSACGFGEVGGFFGDWRFVDERHRRSGECEVRSVFVSCGRHSSRRLVERGGRG